MNAYRRRLAKQRKIQNGEPILTKSERRALREQQWCDKHIIKKATKKLENKRISQLGYDIVIAFTKTNLRKNEDNFSMYLKSQFDREKDLTYNEYQVLLDMVLLGR